VLKLDRKIKLDAAAIASPNLCERFSKEDLTRLGTWALDGYQQDKASRKEWERRMMKAMRMAMQITKPKNKPWPNCSNVAFPLVTISAIQFHSRAYPAMIPGPELVRYNSPNQIRAGRVGTHMSYQMLEESATWEETHDRLIYNVAIVGCAFKKSYHDSVLGQNVSDLVMAKDLVMDYYAKSVDACVRKTHRIPLYRNEVYERVMLGTYSDIRQEAWYTDPQLPTEEYPDDEDLSGQNQPSQVDEATPFYALEQHCWIDLDGDGYAEPYILTVEESSGDPLRLVTRFDREFDIKRNARNEIIQIHAEEFFTKYGLLPAPDGSIYDIGFGILLGPLNDSVSTIVNQLVDAGTMSNGAGGFLGRGAKMRGGEYSFAPFEWKRIDSMVEDLQKAVFPLPVREPSAVLFNLLGLLINYTQRIAGATDTISGENPGQNTPAETSRSMVNEGMKIYNAIYKRLWRSMKEEFKKWYVLNGKNLKDRAMRAEYLDDPNLVGPASSPYILSEEQEMKQAITLKQAAMTTPGYDRAVVEKKFLKALRVPDIDVVFPGADKVPPLPNPKMQVEEGKMKIAMAKLKAEEQQFILGLMEEQKLNKAKIAELAAKAMHEVAQAQGVKAGHEIAMFEAEVGLLKARNEAIDEFTQNMLKGLDQDAQQQAAGQGSDGRGVQGMAKPSGDGGAAQLPEQANAGA
jgi:chaperonin GroES